MARTIAELAGALHDAHIRAGRIGLVPTMGSLHEGHLSLVDRAVAGVDVTVVSIFVNPMQFGPGEDLDRYPRDLERDRALCDARGADIVFAPEVAELYPDGGALVTVDPGRLADRFCGTARPGHFRGVLTVVAKLFSIVRPDVAVFGRKDLQQAVLVRRMTADLDFGVEIDVAPIVREADGLALSSRNAYLSAAEREQAVGLVRGLEAARRAYRAGGRTAAGLEEQVRAEVRSRPLLDLEYVGVVRMADLEPVDPAGPASAVLVAARCGTTRLIDNVLLDGAP